MEAYIKILSNLIEEQISLDSDFIFLKIENFTEPQIYLKIAENLKYKINNDLLIKLSREKYDYWYNTSKYKYTLEIMKKNDLVANEKLTAFRNKKQNEELDKITILLMGSEAVEDQGGLKDFYTITPEVIESKVGDHYSNLFEIKGINLNDEEKQFLNIVYKTVFKCVQKDLYKLSKFIDTLPNNVDFYNLVNEIFETLYKWWRIPNIKAILSEFKKIKNKNNIDLIESAYKFSRRVGIEKFLTDKKIEKLKKDAKDYYERYKNDLESEFDEKFPGYNNFDDFMNNLIEYIEGKDFSNEEKLFNCDFKEINKILKYKKTGTIINSKKTLKTSGEPFKAIAIPILLELNDLEFDEKDSINRVSIEINQISLVNTKSIDNQELYSKWKDMCRFLGGIEELFNKFIFDGKIKVDIFSEVEGENIYPFDTSKINNLIEEGILKTSAQNNANSKIKLDYNFIKDDIVVVTKEYEWNISETDMWIYVFNFMNGQFYDLMQQKMFLPIGIDKKLDIAFDVKNEEEFIYAIKDLDIEYRDLIEICSNKNIISQTSVQIENLGTKFVEFLKGIDENGLFGCMYKQSNIVIDFINTYNKTIPLVIQDIKQENYKDITNAFSKVLLTLNSDDLYSKNILGALMNPYHPVMLEKIVDRYNYLAKGFSEILIEILENNKKKFSKKLINNKFNRFEQLSTITSGASIMEGDSNTFVVSKMTYDFYSLYGKPNDDYRGSTIKVDFEVQEDMENLKQDNPISTYISKTIYDYLKVYPYKTSGIDIGFVNYNNYKVIINGIYDIISRFKKSNLEFKINVYIYTSDYTCSGKNYIKYWIEDKFNEEDNIKIKVYLKYAYLSSKNIEDYVKNNFVEVDILFLNELLEIKEIEAKRSNNNFIKKLENRYPSVYLPVPCNEDRYRKVCISQNQFESESMYTQLIVNVSNSNVEDSNYRIIKKVELTEENEKIMNELHKKSNWVAVLDENIDTKILSLNENKIIGFSTGNGYFGEINIAISTRKDKLYKLESLLNRKLKTKFNTWKTNQIKRVTEKCIDSALNLDGAEIIKSINLNDEYINNYLAYMLTIEYEKILDTQYNSKYYIRKVVNLDSHSHLFDNQLDLVKEDDGNNRPDFLVIEVPIETNKNQDENINIKIKIIECKLANKNESHIEKAKIQVEQGYKRLNKIWNKDSDSVEKRFWFNQLYRLLAYENAAERINDNQQKEFIENMLGKINEGQFDIEFENYIYAFWIDGENDNEQKEMMFEEDAEITISMFSNKSIKSMLVKDYDEEIDVDEENQNDNETETKEYESEEGSENSNTDNIEENNDGDNVDKTSESVDSQTEENESNDNYDSVETNEQWHTGIIDLLEFSDEGDKDDQEESVIVENKIKRLKNELEIRNIKIIPQGFTIGPDIVRIKISLGTGVDFGQIEKNAENMKLWLEVDEKPLIFIEKGFVNIDIVRSKRRTIRMANILKKLNSNFEKYADYKDKFYVLIGEDILGNVKMIDLDDSNSPHLLIAGQTGSGKSVLLNAMLLSIMFMYEPSDVEMVLIDPKQVELTVFDNSPYTKNNNIITEADAAIAELDSLVKEMERRYKLFRNARVKNIANYNKKYPDKKEKRILLVFDEFGAMIESSKDVRNKLESAIKQLAQKARAAGIHMIISTQTPRADIITTTIRNNLTARIALKVTDSNASNLILDEKGAESLLGKGDMLVKTGDSSNFARTKSPFIEEFDVGYIIDYFKEKEL